MPVNHESKYLFIHIPKTGGTSIESFLNLDNPQCHHDASIRFLQGEVDYALQHLTALIYKTYFLKPEDFKTYFKFTFVRNPYDRSLSRFFFSRDGFLEKNVIDPVPFWIRDKVKSNQPDFSPEAFHEFVIRTNKVTKKLNEHFPSQSDFVLDENGNSLIDFIGKFENLKEDLAKVMDILKINKPIEEFPHHYKTLVKYDKSEYLTPECKEHIYKKFQKDFELFGYEK